MSAARVLIVDDSASARALIRALLARDPAIEVVGEAGDPYEARAAIKAINPDVITLDVEMPHMNGLDFLDKIMRLRPTPVIMVSSLADAGLADAVEGAALERRDGCVGKPGVGEQERFGAALAQRGKAAAARRPRFSAPAQPAREAAEKPYRSDGRVVALGASTGGVEALIAVLSRFPQNGPPLRSSSTCRRPSRRASRAVSTVSAAPACARRSTARRSSRGTSISPLAARRISWSSAEARCAAVCSAANRRTAIALPSTCCSMRARANSAPARSERS